MSVLALVLTAASVKVTSAADHPQLAQAWVALSTGDGLPGQTGKESYLYEQCKETSDSCVQAHIWDYGQSCTKYEINKGFHSKFSGEFYVNCDAVDCCVSDPDHIPDVKEWLIGQTGAMLHDNVVHVGQRTIADLTNKSVNADVWYEEFDIPFAKAKANYTYFITQDGDDVISHRIDFGALTEAGTILYGDFQVQHNLTSFREVFQPPAPCLKPNVLKCNNDKVKLWEDKYFRR